MTIETEAKIRMQTAVQSIADALFGLTPQMRQHAIDAAKARADKCFEELKGEFKDECEAAQS